MRWKSDQLIGAAKERSTHVRWERRFALSPVRITDQDVVWLEHYYQKQWLGSEWWDAGMSSSSIVDGPYRRYA